MTSSTSDVSLEPVGAALVAARDALDRRAAAVPSARESADAAVQGALVDLAVAACDVVSSWEGTVPESDEGEQQSPPLVRRVGRWRTEIDDLRVQAALAEMELRDASHQVVERVEQTAGGVEKRLTDAVRELTSALGTFRASLRPRA